MAAVWAAGPEPMTMAEECIVRRGMLGAVAVGNGAEDFRVKETVEAARGRVMAERRGEVEKRWKLRKNSLREVRY